jgi:hypothetical protein
MNRAVAAVERQIERRADLGAGCDGGKVRRQRMQVAVGPNQHRAAGAQIGEIDPMRAVRQAVDQHPRLRARIGIMRDIAAVPRRADDVLGLMLGRGLEPLRDRRG